MNIDELISSALEQQASRAPGPEGTRAALPIRTRAHRRRRLVGTAGIAVVTAAVLVAIPTLVRAQQQDQALAQAGASAAPTTPPAPAGYAIDYRPTWLPDGMVERERSVDTVGTTVGSRYRFYYAQSDSVWTPGGGVHLSVAARPTSVPRDQLSDARPVDINSIAGTVGARGTVEVEVNWPISQDTFMVVRVSSHIPDASNVAIRVAKSVVADTTTRLVAPLTLGWLPSQVAQQPLRPQRNLDLSGDSAEQWQLTTWFDYGQSGGEGLSWFVSVGTRRPEFLGGTPVPVTVRGRSGLVLVAHMGGKFDTNAGMLQVDLDGGLVLTLQANSVYDPADANAPQISVEDMVHILNSVEIGPTPDLSWIGGHA